jgi:hypothetical protein
MTDTQGAAILIGTLVLVLIYTLFIRKDRCIKCGKLVFVWQNYIRIYHHNPSGHETAIWSSCEHSLCPK